MKKRRLYVLILSVICLLCFGLFAFGCDCNCSGDKDVELPVPEKEIKVELNKYSASLSIGGEYQIVVKTPIAGATYTYTSADSAIATVTDTGLVKGIKNGKTDVTVSYKDKSAKCAINVVNVGELPVIKIDTVAEGETVNMFKGDKLTFEPTLYFYGAIVDGNIDVSSSQASVISYDNGKITANALGSATVTVTAEYNDTTVIKTIDFNVVNDSQIQLSVSAIKLATSGIAGQESEFTVPAPVVLKDGQTVVSEVQWISLDESIATVDGLGKITAKKAGQTQIKVTAKAGTDDVDAFITVTVFEPYLERPQNITVSENLLTWDRVDYAEKYEIFIDAEKIIVEDSLFDGENAFYDVSTCFGMRSLAIKAIAQDGSNIADSEVVETHKTFQIKDLTALTEATSERFKTFEATISKVEGFSERDVYYADCNENIMASGKGKVFNLVYYTAAVANRANPQSSDYKPSHIHFNKAVSFIDPFEPLNDYTGKATISFWTYTYNKDNVANKFYFMKNPDISSNTGVKLEEVEVPANKWTKVTFALDSNSFRNEMFCLITTEQNFYYTDIKILSNDYVDYADYSDLGFYVGFRTQEYLDSLPAPDSVNVVDAELISKIEDARKSYDSLVDDRKATISTADLEKLCKLEKIAFAKQFIGLSASALKVSDGGLLVKAQTAINDAPAGIYSAQEIKDVTDLKTAYDSKFIMVTDVAKANIIEETTSATIYEGNESFSDKGYVNKVTVDVVSDILLGDVQAITTIGDTINGNAGNHLILSNFVQTVKDILDRSENKGAKVEFFVKGSNTLDFGTDGTALKVDLTSKDWVKIALYEKDFDKLTGKIYKMWDSGTFNVYFSNVYVVKPATVQTQVIAMINALPETSDIEMLDGVAIYSAYEEYNTAKEGGITFDKAVTDKLNAVKTEYDKYWSYAKVDAKFEPLRASDTAIDQVASYYLAKVSVGFGSDSVYGTTQVVTAIKGSGDTGLHVIFSAKKQFDKIKTMLNADDNLVSVKFFVRVTGISRGLELRGPNPDEAGKFKTILTMPNATGDWQEIVITKADFLKLSGVMIKDYMIASSVGTTTIEFTDFYLIKGENLKQEATAAIQALPSVTDLDEFDYEQIYAAYTLYENTVAYGVTLDSAVSSKMLEVKAEYDKYWSYAKIDSKFESLRASDTAVDQVASYYLANVSTGFGTDSVYGTTQVVTATKGSGDTGLHVIFSAKKQFDKIKTMLNADDSVVYVKFYVKVTGTSRGLELRGPNPDEAGKFKTILTLPNATGNWQEIVINTADFLKLNGVMIRDYMVSSSIGTTTIEFTDFILVKAEILKEEVVSAVQGLPETSALDMFDYEQVYNVYSIYQTAVEKGVTFDTATTEKMTAVKNSYDAKWVKATDIASGNIVKSRTSAYSGIYDHTVGVKTATDIDYGTIQEVSIARPSVSTAHSLVEFDATVFEGIRSILDENAGASVQFYMRGNACDHKWFFGTSARPDASKTASGSGYEGKVVTLSDGTSSDWVLVTFTAEEFKELNGIMSILDRKAISKVEITDFFVVKA